MPGLPDSLRVAITHTRYSFSGGIEKYIHSLVERLLERGHEVHYIAHRWEERDHPRLHFHRAKMIRFPQSLRVLSFNRACNRVLDRHAFDLVHGFTKTDRQDVYTDGSGCLEEYIEATHPTWPAWRRRMHRMTPHQQAIQLMERRRFQKDSILRIVPMADFVRDQILRHYPVDPARVETIYNGVELERFHPSNRLEIGRAFRERHDIAPDRQVLLFVGNDWFRKGLDTVLDAMPEVAAKVPGSPLLAVAGHDNHPERFQQHARRVGAEVAWIGPVREIHEAFAASDLFVFPSRYDVFGNVGLEALASGVPSLLSARAGVGELLAKHPGPGGHVIQDPADPHELAAAAIEFLQGDPEPRRRAARAIAEQYSWDEHFERLLEVYALALEEKRGASRSLTEA